MTFLNVSLLFGGVLLGIPIVLHLVMRRQPKPLVFPAMQFLKPRRETNRRKLQWRHWLLLLLRCLAVAVLAIMLARPSVLSAAVGRWATLGILGAVTLLFMLAAVGAIVQQAGRLITVGLCAGAGLLLLATLAGTAWALGAAGELVIGDREAPVGAAMLVDTSPRMLYRHNNETRLEHARQLAGWLLRQLPLDSQVAVAESNSESVVFSVDLAAASRSLERLEATAVPRPLTEILVDAVGTVAASDRDRQEVYVFTDLSSAAWQPSGTSTGAKLRTLLQDHPEVMVYVIDVGVEAPRNVALGRLQFSTEVVSGGSPVSISTDVSATGMPAETTLELYLEEPDPRLPLVVDGQLRVPPATRRDSRFVKLADGESQQVEMELQGLPPGTHQGYLQLLGEDGLRIDDRRYFAIQVQRAWPLLVVAPEDVVDSFLVEAIASYEYRKTGLGKFDCRTGGPDALNSAQLEDFATVCLLDPPALSPLAWQRLTDYVEAGGSVAAFLGHNAQPSESFNEPSAQLLLAGQLARQWRSRDGLYLAPQSFQHPVTAVFGTMQTSVPWPALPVFRHWVLDPVAADAVTILPFNNQQPAILERNVGRGKAITMTTPVSDPLRPAGRATWNELPTSEYAWPYVMLMDKLMTYLVGSADEQLNYLAGETATLTNDSRRDPERYQLFSPSEEPHDVVARDGRLVVRFTDVPGAYRFKGGNGETVVRGFAVNYSPSDSDLVRTTPETLDELLGPNRYQLAREKEEINRDIGQARRGREFYPFLLVVLVVVLGLEHLLSNQFYCTVSFHSAS